MKLDLEVWDDGSSAPSPTSMITWIEASLEGSPRATGLDRQKIFYRIERKN